MIQSEVSGDQLFDMLRKSIDQDTQEWILERKEKILSTSSAKELYMAYSLLSGKIDSDLPLELSSEQDSVSNYLREHQATALQLARIYLLVCVLEANHSYFSSKVANLIQLADTSELETFLKFLTFLPHAEDYKNAAVEALRTNIATIFDAISLKNPYPSEYFNDQQWNQMYLKAAFMQRNLADILDVDKRANKDLARIISDYAHERWAASRDIDPLFWRPVSNFLEGILLEDMKRLLSSGIPAENHAGALVCYNSDKTAATELLEPYPDLKVAVQMGDISWSKIANKKE